MKTKLKVNKDNKGFQLKKSKIEAIDYLKKGATITVDQEERTIKMYYEDKYLPFTEFTLKRFFVQGILIPTQGALGVFAEFKLDPKLIKKI